MDTFYLTFGHQLLTNLSLNVLIENEREGGITATVLGLPDCKVKGANRQEALESLRQLLVARLEGAEIVPLEIKSPKPEHPWMKFAGKYKDDPHFDEMLEYIEAYRGELDAETEAYYRQLDTEDEAK